MYILIPVPSRKRNAKCRPLRQNALDYLNQKGDKENFLRQKEIELEERKLELEERRLALEERKCVIEEQKLKIELEERHQKLELERERIKMEISERQNLNKLINSQQTIIESLLQKNKTEMYTN